MLVWDFLVASDWFSKSIIWGDPSRFMVEICTGCDRMPLSPCLQSKRLLPKPLERCNWRAPSLGFWPLALGGYERILDYWMTCLSLNGNKLQWITSTIFINLLGVIRSSNHKTVLKLNLEDKHSFFPSSIATIPKHHIELFFHTIRYQVSIFNYRLWMYIL